MNKRKYLLYNDQHFYFCFQDNLQKNSLYNCLSYDDQILVCKKWISDEIQNFKDCSIIITNVTSTVIHTPMWELMRGSWSAAWSNMGSGQPKSLNTKDPYIMRQGMMDIMYTEFNKNNMINFIWTWSCPHATNYRFSWNFEYILYGPTKITPTTTWECYPLEG